MNTGRFGGPEAEQGSKKVRIPHSSAIVKAIADGTIEWERDPDFGYLVAASVPDIDASDIDILNYAPMLHNGPESKGPEGP